MKLYVGSVKRNRNIQASVGTLDSAYTVSRTHSPTTAKTASIDPTTTMVEYGQNVPRYHRGGLLVAEARTNGIRNPRGEGATTNTVASGVSPALPTNWSTPNRSTGLSMDVSAITGNGMTGLRVRYYGTTTGAPTAEGFDFEPRNAVAALAAQVWTGSFYYKLAAGTLPTGMAILTRLLSHTGASVVDSFTQTLTAPDTTLRRSAHTGTLSGTTAFVTFGWLLQTFPASTACDFTIDVFYPQLELGNGVTAVALPVAGTPTASTRGVDVITRSIAPISYPSRNLFINSEAMASMPPGNTTVNTGVTPGPYTGTLGDGIVTTAISAFHHLLPTTAAVAGKSYAVSVYAKAGTCNFLRVTVPTLFVGLYPITYTVDLTTGATLLQFGSTPGVNPSITVTNIGAGWWRATVNYTATNTSASAPTAIGPAPTAGTTTFLGDGTEGIYVWGAQHCEASGVPAYIKTTATAAASHSKGTLVLTGKFTGTMPTTGFAGIASVYDDGNAQVSWFYNAGAGTLEGNLFSRALALVDTGGSFILAPVLNQYFRLAFSWDTSTGYYGFQAHNGSTLSIPVTGTLDLMPVFNILGIGTSPVAATAGSMEFQRVALYSAVVPAASLNQLIAA